MGDMHAGVAQVLGEPVVHGPAPSCATRSGYRMTRIWVARSRFPREVAHGLLRGVIHEFAPVLCLRAAAKRWKLRPRTATHEHSRRARATRAAQSLSTPNYDRCLRPAPLAFEFLPGRRMGLFSSSLDDARGGAVATST